MKYTEYTDSHNALGRPRGYLDTVSTRLGSEMHGYVETPDGVVLVHGGESSLRGWMSLTVCRGGRSYSRRYDRAFSERRAVTLAARFARQVAGADLRRGQVVFNALAEPWPPPADVDRVMGYDPTAMMGPRWSDLIRGPGWHTWRGYTHWLPWPGNPDAGEKPEGGEA